MDAAASMNANILFSERSSLARRLKERIHSERRGMTEAREIYRLGCFLLGREKLVSRPLRLLGLGVANLGTPQAQQLVLL